MPSCFLTLLFISLFFLLPFINGRSDDAVKDKGVKTMVRRENKKQQDRVLSQAGVFCDVNAENALESFVQMVFYGSPALLLPAEITELEGAIMSSYNLVSSSYGLPNENCLLAGGFRNITGVSLATNLTELQEQPQYRDETTSVAFLLKFRVTALCRRCLPNTPIFAESISNYQKSSVPQENDIFFSGVPSTGGDSCGCTPIQLEAFLLHFDLEFQMLRSRRVISSSLQDIVDVVEARPVDCAPNPTTFSTTVLVDVSHSDPNLFTNPQALTQMADAFVTAYNNINGISLERTCDLSFRRAVSATVRIGDLNPAYTTATTKQRQLAQGFQNDGTFFFMPSFTTLLFSVTAECRGCNASSTTMFESTSSVAETPASSFTRKLGQALGNYNAQQNDQAPWNTQEGDFSHAGRILNQQPEECICPVEAELRAKTEFEFLDAYNTTLSLSLDDSVWIDDVIEIVTVPCDSAPTDFNTTVDVDLDGNPEVLQSTNGTARIATEFLSVYNNIAQRFCDPFFRFASSVAASILGPTTPGSRLLQTSINNFTLPPGPPNTTFRFRVRLVITGVCRGCQQDSSIFDDGFRRRMLGLPDNDEPYDRDRRRRWLQGDDCYCATINVVDGAPTERDFFIAYDREIQSLTSNGAIEGLSGVASVEEEKSGANNQNPTKQIECQMDSDCVNQGEGDLCVFNECLFNGNLRFTLTWTGDDDYDLAVTNPSGNVVFWDSVFDSVARGVFDTGFVQDVQGNHVESIFYSTSRHTPAGFYSVSVTQFEQRGTADNWLLRIYVGGVERQSISGFGTTESLTYLVSDGVPPAECSVKNNGAQCCSNDDCANNMLGDLCVNSQCIFDGEVRVTLTYFGDDTLTLFAGTQVGFELVSAGVFEPDENEFQSGFHTVNIYSSDPSNPPPYGEYFFFVDLIEQRGVALDEWRVEFVENGIVQRVETGTGASGNLSFLRIPNVAGLAAGLTGPCSVDPVLIHCCSDIDCLASETCSHFKCIPKGSPQFTLSWFGYNDLDIFVDTPDDNHIFWANPDDPNSLITLRDDPDPSSITHVETVYAPLGTAPPVGEYRYGVNVWDATDPLDTWHLTVTVDGTVVASHQGTGQSNLFFLNFGGGGNRR